MISSNARGYTLFKKGAPYFLQIASTIPNLWAPNSAIFISNTLQCEQYELRAFALVDTVSSLAFGIPPLLHYDTTPTPIEPVKNSHLLEWVYGCPADIIILLAKINSRRASRWIESPPTVLDAEEWKVVEKLLNAWTPTIEKVDESSSLVLRLAIQESWRQAGFIYLYMVRFYRLVSGLVLMIEVVKGMCGLSSDDLRVQRPVKQIAQLARTIEPGAQLEPHMFLPCLIVRSFLPSSLHPI